MIHITSDGIIVNFEGSYFLISEVKSDEKGIFLDNFEAVRWVRCPNPDCQLVYDADRYTSQCPHNRMRISG